MSRSRWRARLTLILLLALGITGAALLLLVSAEDGIGPDRLVRRGFALLGALACLRYALAALAGLAVGRGGSASRRVSAGLLAAVGPRWVRRLAAASLGTATLLSVGSGALALPGVGSGATEAGSPAGGSTVVAADEAAEIDLGVRSTAPGMLGQKVRPTAPGDGGTVTPAAGAEAVPEAGSGTGLDAEAVSSSEGAGRGDATDGATNDGSDLGSGAVASGDGPEADGEGLPADRGGPGALAGAPAVTGAKVRPSETPTTQPASAGADPSDPESTGHATATRAPTMPTPAPPFDTSASASPTAEPVSASQTVPAPAVEGASAEGVPAAYTVRSGDSLWGIARAHGAETDAEIADAWPRWHELNRDVIGADPDLIQPGQVLRVPAADLTGAPS
ncbi:MAG: hypothetical protein BGO96_03740 [Micrococcales bacterium 73-15]|uniref:LysM peptidoglycan-binding domain-containing protein n=1 Tax=Salana multivorans TaxID=120377 RepID=UPI000962CCC6|nr:LysM peptidoglycan-binding domain-containing protein [Salana multivorans]OJX98308.1 MAG: hypothetical protein BGO96_03740 [Micrococcales bacterium 73-15]